MAPRPDAQSLSSSDSNSLHDHHHQHMPAESIPELAVASKPKDDSLYQELLRFHDEGDAVSVHTEAQASSFTSNSEDDKKPAAKPRAELAVQSEHTQPSRDWVDDTNDSIRRRLVVSNSPPITSHRQDAAQRRSLSPPKDEAFYFKSTGPPVYRDSAAAAPISVPHDETGIAGHVTSFTTKPSVTAPLPSYDHDSSMPSFSDIKHFDPETIPFDEPTNTERRPSAEPPRPPIQKKASTPKHEKKSSFYESALEASGHSSPEAVVTTDPDLLAEDEKLARELTRRLELEEAQARADPLDEKLALELSRQLELEEAAKQQRRRIPSPVSDPTQMEIMNKIRQEAEQKQMEALLRETGVPMGGTSVAIEEQKQLEAVLRESGAPMSGTSVAVAKQKQLEAALRESGVPMGGPVEFVSDQQHQHHATSAEGGGSAMADYLLSQQLAMEEWRHVPRTPMRRTSSDRLPNTTSGDDVPYRVSMEYYTPNPSATTRPAAPAPRARSFTASSNKKNGQQDDELVHRGSLETQEAIANGRAHVVQCRGCSGRLHAPMSYSLVYCPQCHTVSPGQTYLARGDDRASSSLRRQRSKHNGNGGNKTSKHT